MSDLSTLRRMTTYMAWADDVTLRNAEQRPEVDLMGPRDALFTTISGTFDHILVVGEIFRAHLEGRSHPHLSVRRSTPLPFHEVATRLRAMDNHFVALARRWSEADLAEVIDFEFVGGGKGAMSRADILLHLVNHSTYHRGFASTLLFPLRINTAASDLTVFLRDVWPSLSGTADENQA